MHAAGQGIGLIADDLTGACDAALPFFRSGARVVLHASPADGPEYLAPPLEIGMDGPQLLAFNVATRHATPSAIPSMLASSVGCLKQAGIERVFLKIDSTLRGPMGALCWAVAEAFQADLVVIAPALPSSHRQTVGGYQLVAGEPVERSVAGRDARTPVHQSHVPTVLAETLPEALRPKATELIGHVPLSVVIRGAAPILSALLAAHKSGQRLVVVDATHDTDLEQLALALEKATQKLTVVPCGSAGFAAVLAPRWVEIPDEVLESTAKATYGFLHGSRCIGVMGSNTPLSHEQLDALESLEGVVRLVIPPEVLLGLEPLDAFVERVQAVWEQGRIPIATTAWPQGAVTHTLALASEHQLTPQAVYYRINHTLSQLAQAVTQHHHMQQAALKTPTSLVTPLTWWASGGDTAEAVALGIQALASGIHADSLAQSPTSSSVVWQLVKETRTGLPVLSTHLPCSQVNNGFSESSQGAEVFLPIRLITRSGNFGTSTALHAFFSRWLLQTSQESSVSAAP